MNREARRAQASKDRKEAKARGIAPAATIEVPLHEKDPAQLALRVRKLEDDLEQMSKVSSQNLEQIGKAFAMVDAHQHVNNRIMRDLSMAVSGVRRLCVDGDVTLSMGDLGDLRVTPEGVLHMTAYYQEHSKVVELAGKDYADVAVVLWSRGYAPEDAADRAKLEKTRRNATETSALDTDYEDEFFEGAADVQDHHQQDPQATNADG